MALASFQDSARRIGAVGKLEVVSIGGLLFPCSFEAWEFGTKGPAAKGEGVSCFCDCVTLCLEASIFFVLLLYP